MTLKEYLDKNGVTFNIWKDETKNLEFVIGNEVFICDYRNGEDVFGKPIRNIEPKKVMVFDANEAKKNIYYSPVYFREIKADGKLLKQEISPYDNTGFRGRTGTSVNIFTDMEQCVSCYQEQLKKAKTEFLEAFNKIKLIYANKFDFITALQKKYQKEV